MTRKGDKKPGRSAKAEKKAKNHCVYLLLCKGNRIYTGYAVDLETRFMKHCQGTAAHFTRAFPPLRLLGSIDVPDRSTGLRLEAAIKKLSTRQKRQLIAELQQSHQSA